MLKERDEKTEKKTITHRFASDHTSLSRKAEDAEEDAKFWGQTDIPSAAVTGPVEKACEKVPSVKIKLTKVHSAYQRLHKKQCVSES